MVKSNFLSFVIFLNFLSFSFDEYVSSTILQGPLNKKDLKTFGLSVGVKKLWFNLRAERLLYWNKQPSNNDEKTMKPEGT